MPANSKIPQISIVIPCYKQPVELKNCLAALHDQKCDLDYEIIVVDSEPSEIIRDVAKNFPEIKLIRGADNLKPGAARNLGVKDARSEYIAFIDSDCIPNEHWLQQAFESLEKGHKLVGGPIVDRLPLHPISSIDNLLQFVDFSAKRPSGIAEHIPAGNSAVPKEVFNS
ncbi:MAG: glycosyltransferase, partial [Nitrosopumilaceae archaeon]|nr:glycosyltransferase [Nitrosopumilaceae archaeon]